MDGEGNRREVRLALTTRTTAENDDDEKDWETTLNRGKAGRFTYSERDKARRLTYAGGAITGAFGLRPHAPHYLSVLLTGFGPSAPLKN